jgi:hypothetical protein
VRIMQPGSSVARRLTPGLSVIELPPIGRDGAHSVCEPRSAGGITSVPLVKLLHISRFLGSAMTSRPVTAEPARRRRSHGWTSRSETSRRRYSLKERLSHYQRKWTTQRVAGHSPRLILAQGKRLWRMASDEQSAAIFCMRMRLRASNCSQRTVMRTPLCVEYGAKSSIRATMTPGARSSMGL